MNTPNLYVADDIKKWNTLSQINNKWVLARPLGLWGLCLKTRMVYAWKVFIGKYDVLTWKEGQ